MKRNITARLLAALVSISVTLSGLPGAAASQEQFSWSDAALETLTFTAGTLADANGAPAQFQPGQTDYRLTLAPDEDAFCLIYTPVESAPSAAPTVEVDYGEGPMALGGGEASERIALGPGEQREITLRSTPANPEAAPAVYTVTAYRAQTAALWIADAPEPLPEGGALLRVRLRLPEGTRFHTLQTALGFDPAALQLCGADGVPSEAWWDCMRAPMCDDAPPENAFEPVLYTLDNTRGIAALQFGWAESNTGKTAYTAGTEEDVVTLFFRMARGAALNEAALHILTDSVRPQSGFAITEYSALAGGFVSAGSPKMAAFDRSAHEHALQKPGEAEGGRLILEPDRSAYYRGERVTVTAKAASGRAFSGWGGQAVINGEAVSPEGNPFAFILDGDADLSGLTAVFSKGGEELASGAALNTEAPYTGEYLMLMNEPYGASVTLGGSIERASIETADAANASVMGADTQGNTVLEYQETPEAAAAGAAVFSNEGGALAAGASYVIGDTTMLMTRNLSGQGAAWAPKEFRLAAVGQSVNLWFESGNPMQLTAAQFDELTDSFDESMAYLGRLGGCYDRNGNGRLDVLLYDIQDGYAGSGAYYQGMQSYAELYGGMGGRAAVGNNADVLHLDTYPSMGGDYTAPSLAGVEATMAHETQHLVLASRYSGDMENGMSLDALADELPGTWLNEGISMAVEHARFGRLDSRIETFNRSSAIPQGIVSLTDWGQTTDNYALSYLFMEYVLAQAGGDDFLQTLYRSYAGGEEAALMDALRQIPAFSELHSLAEVMERFYAALLLQEATGVYGFAGDPQFHGVAPRVRDALPYSLASGGVTYIALRGGTFTPEHTEHLRCLGVTPAKTELTLTIPQTEGGTVRRASEGTYALGDTVKLTAVPDDGYVFSHWSGGEHGTRNPLTVTMGADRTIFAVFEAREFVAASALLEGAVSVADSVLQAPCDGGYMTLTAGKTALSADTKLEVGAAIELTATPDAGKRFIGWRRLEAASPEAYSVESAPGTLLAQNPMQAQVRAGVRYQAVFAEAESADILRDMFVSVPGREDTAKLLPAGAAGAAHGFRADTHVYDLYLLPEETGFTLWAESSAAVRVEAADGAAEELAMQDGLGMAEITVREAESHITVTADGAAPYFVNIHRPAAAPAVTLRIDAGTAGQARLTADFSNVELGVVQFTLLATEGALTAPDAEIQLPFGSRAATVRVQKQPARQGMDRFLITLYPETAGETVDLGGESGVTLAAFACTGVLPEWSVSEQDATDAAAVNSITDARYLALYGRVAKASGAQLQGSLTAYDPGVPIYAQAYQWDGMAYVPYGARVEAVAAQTGTGLFTAPYCIAVPETARYRVVFSKAYHVDAVVESETGGDGIVTETIYLPYGDLDGDGATGLADRNLLVSVLYGNGNTADCDLDGDGKTTLADLNLLMQEKNYNKRLQTVAAELKGV